MAVAYCPKMRFYRFKTLGPNSLSQKHKSFGKSLAIVRGFFMP